MAGEMTVAVFGILAVVRLLRAARSSVGAVQAREEQAGTDECAACGYRGAPRYGLCVKCRSAWETEVEDGEPFEAIPDLLPAPTPAARSLAEIFGYEDWTPPWETGLVTDTGACCERPNLYVVRTACDGTLLASVMRCASCERFSFPPTISFPFGGDGPTGHGKLAVWRSLVRHRAVEQAYTAK
jgi:hypothetical protein